IWEGMSFLEQAKATLFCHGRMVLFYILVSIWMRVFAGLVQSLILIQGLGRGRGRDQNERRATEVAENKFEASCSHAETRW
ncbi:hypothetical protein LZ30DRAFT_570364, partial [Colletotrichum cereale]